MVSLVLFAYGFFLRGLLFHIQTELTGNLFIRWLTIRKENPLLLRRDSWLIPDLYPWYLPSKLLFHLLKGLTEIHFIRFPLFQGFKSFFSWFPWWFWL
jgi:hypothetical protein